MKLEDAARRLTLHLMQCGMLMPIEWIRENGEGSELQEAFRIALDALGHLENHMEQKKPCFVCDNARVNDELDSRNDLHYHTVAESEEGFRILIAAGGGKPLRILFEQRRKFWADRKDEVWVTVADFEPKFCPNCGRELAEYGGKDE